MEGFSSDWAESSPSLVKTMGASDRDINITKINNGDESSPSLIISLSAADKSYQPIDIYEVALNYN